MQEQLFNLEMEWNNGAFGVDNNLYKQHNPCQQSMKELSDVELLTRMLLEDDFPSLFELEGTIHPIVPSSLSISTEQLPPPMPRPPHCNVELPQRGSNVSEPQSSNESKQNDATGGGTRRKRRPRQVSDHIIAERKRREVLGQRFISLSAIVPGLQKVDKLTILDGAIKHIKELVEKVEALEDAAAKQSEESMVRIKRSKMAVDNDDDSSCIVEDVYVFGGSGISDSLPEIEVTVSNNSVILRFYCKKQIRMTGQIVGEMENYGIIALQTTVVPLGNSVYNHIIVGQAENTDKKLMKDLVTSLRLILHAL